MVFSSIAFLFQFLPIVVVGYYILPRDARNAWLLLSSLVFYAWGEPSFVAVMILSITVNNGVAPFPSGNMRCRARFWKSPSQIISRPYWGVTGKGCRSARNMPGVTNDLFVW